MRKILFILIALLSLNSSCKGPRGLPGIEGKDGKDGIDGESFLGSVFEIKGTFSNKNDYLLAFDFPNYAEVYDTDIVLVYILWDVFEPEAGKKIDIWRMLPQVRYLDQGILKYDFDYTYSDVNIFLEGDIDFNSLKEGDIKDQIFRIAVLPADFLKSSEVDGYENIDFNNMEIIKMY